MPYCNPTAARACNIDPEWDAHPYHQLLAKGFKNLGESNGWGVLTNHPSRAIYEAHDDWVEIYNTIGGYHLYVSLSAQAFYESDSSD